MYFVSLCDETDLVEKTCDLLDTEWPKSRGLRKRKLLSSPSPNLPMSVLMIKDKTVIGHYRLSEALEDKRWCVVESVIIVQQQRGLGLGLELMEHCLSFAASISMDRMFLSTKDKMGFYAKLGFVEGSAVSVLSKVNAIFRDRHLLGPSTKTSLPGTVWMNKSLK